MSVGAVVCSTAMMARVGLMATLAAGVRGGRFGCRHDCPDSDGGRPGGVRAGGGRGGAASVPPLLFGRRGGVWGGARGRVLGAG